MNEVRQYTYEDFGATFHQLGWLPDPKFKEFSHLYGKWWHEVVPQTIVKKRLFRRAEIIHVHHAQTRVVNGGTLYQICPCGSLKSSNGSQPGQWMVGDFGIGDPQRVR
jgi:hypothetical protein